MSCSSGLKKQQKLGWSQHANKGLVGRHSISGFGPLSRPSSSLTVELDAKICCEVVENEEYFAKLGLIGRFRCIWPSLPVLHKWISETWGPVVKGEIQIYPCARGFFVVIFDNIHDRNTILCNQWILDKSMLLLKPWHSIFNPAIESFATTPVWVRLPNLPLQFWFDSCFEAIGNSMGKFLYVDEGTSSFFQPTFARILVELDISKDLPAEITLKSTIGSWSQVVDYEGLPFRCQRCFCTGHLASHCLKKKGLGQASWWKEVSPSHYSVKKDEVLDISSTKPSHDSSSFDVENHNVPQPTKYVCSQPPKSGKELKAHGKGSSTSVVSIAHSDPTTGFTKAGPDSGSISPIMRTQDSSLVPLTSSMVKNKECLESASKIIEGNPHCSSSLSSEGWQTVKKKKQKLDMTLRPVHKGGLRRGFLS